MISLNVDISPEALAIAISDDCDTDTIKKIILANV